MKDSAFYYLLKDGVILRSEDKLTKEIAPKIIKNNIFDDFSFFNQEEANKRVIFFRDKIFDLEEYLYFLNGFCF